MLYRQRDACVQPDLCIKIFEPHNDQEEKAWNVYTWTMKAEEEEQVYNFICI